jgi:mannose-6-phosphate isomerase-like protein (cupin superfamily)
MSYPEAWYLGEKGEVSATLRRVDQPAEIVGRSTTCGYLATGASTRGQFGLYRWDFLGPRSGPEPHFHRSISESFYVLSGAVRLYDGDRWVDASAGDFLFVPEGGIHAFRNESGEPASMLILFAPGAPREEYFENVGKAGDLSEEERAAFFLRHDTFWT